MNLFEKLLYFLQAEMIIPQAWGWFHILFICICFGAIIFLYTRRKYYNEKQLKIVLCTYGYIALMLEVLKQLIWAFNYDTVTGIVSWDYEWYSFPFQLCTTPIYVSIICLFLKKGKVRNSLLSYISYVTILGSITTVLMPDSCFVSDILVNIHTMYLHLGSLVVSIYLLMVGEVKTNFTYFKNAIMVFLLFVGIAEFMNIFIYNIGILNGETFNMFYISPYFISSLPVFDILQENLPYMIYLLLYICILITGALVIYSIAIIVIKLNKKFN